MIDIMVKIKDRFPDKILKYKEKSVCRVYLDIKPEDILSLAKFIFEDLSCRFITATGIDTPCGIEIIYHFSQDATGKIISLRVLISDKDKPKIDSIATLFPGADWIEREIWELLGVNFSGHPNLKHLLLIDEWPQGEYPLRRDKKHK